MPGIISHQGRLTIAGTNFTGTAAFKFAIVATNAAGVARTLWSHNGSSVDGAEPADPGLALPVLRGVYSVNLGDMTEPGMTGEIPAGVFTNRAVYLRTWVNDGVRGMLQLSPDRRITAVGYALVAQTVQEPPAGTLLASTQGADTNLTANGYALATSIAAPSWASGSTSNAPSARSGHTAVWTGDGLLVWGGTLAGGAFASSGSTYRPDADAWTAVSTIGAPAARSGHTAVWTGSGMLVWGGSGAAGYLGSGGRFATATQTWAPITTNGAPDGRAGHVAVWTGSRMLVWGGLNTSGLLDDGALYDPASNSWCALSVPAPPEARMHAAAAWCSDRLVIWGGEGADGPLSTGAQLVFSNGVPVAWTALPAGQAPSARSGCTAVWSGEALLVWGGQNEGVPLADGAAYSLSANAWQAMPTAGAPAARYDHAALWSGSELLIVAGAGASGALPSGAAYDPAGRVWRPLSAAGSPLARSQPAAAWNGTEILLFGGLSSGATPVASLQRLVPQPALYLYRKL